MTIKIKKLIFFGIIATLTCFYFSQEVLAEYYSSGTLISGNLLATSTVNSIEYFGYNCTTTATTTLKVQFSQDNTNWYNATHSADTWTELSDGNHLDSDRIGLYGWFADSIFYYKMQFETSNTSTTPVLDEIKIWHNG
ncbi:hypothetical protein AMJ49_06505, partial [Parcubacteria bacterium DG_74_2]